MAHEEGVYGFLTVSGSGNFPIELSWKDKFPKREKNRKFESIRLGDERAAIRLGDEAAIISNSQRERTGGGFIVMGECLGISFSQIARKNVKD